MPENEQRRELREHTTRIVGADHKGPGPSTAGRPRRCPRGAGRARFGVSGAASTFSQMSVPLTSIPTATIGTYLFMSELVTNHSPPWIALGQVPTRRGRCIRCGDRGGVACVIFRSRRKASTP